jgi:hypothetical protein
MNNYENASMEFHFAMAFAKLCGNKFFTHKYEFRGRDVNYMLFVYKMSGFVI